MDKSRIIKLVIAWLIILFIPLIASLSSSKINWKFIDFVLMGILLFIAFGLFEFARIKLKSKVKKNLAWLLIFMLFVCVWVELAVGFFR
ncbi:MAG: hypothetical protein ACON4M_07845 [Crocinitomicaceae bacterium]